jgi:hypothetical protein
MKKIARALHLSRNTVRNILRSGETNFSHERERQPMPHRAVAGPVGAVFILERGQAFARKAEADPGRRGVARAGLRGRP